MKRAFDLLLSVAGLIITAPILVPSVLWIYLGDRKSPFYVAERMGRGERAFRMVKLRSMVVDADKSGVDSTASTDPRITPAGKFVRAYKIDELPQLVNVLKGDMSIVGPRPNVRRETQTYTTEEKRLLAVRPGITDIASIVFADENDILAHSTDPDLLYNQIIRPWKSRLGLVYVDNMSLKTDARLIALTVLSAVSRQKALSGVQSLLAGLKVDAALRVVAARTSPLAAYPPPGADDIVQHR